jgi:hypothetical protein
MLAELRIVDNRVFVLGLDHLYREAMKNHERQELLICARRVASALHVMPADVPIEGYYAEDEQLTEYFRLSRRLQSLDKSYLPAVVSLPEFQRLLNVTSAPLYGRLQHTGKLLPVGRDPLSQALLDTRLQWTMPRLIEAAYSAALKTDDISLVGLAARIKDPVVLTATRESVVLYAEHILGASLREEPQYVWEVDEYLAAHAKRFIDAFNALFGKELPQPEPAHAAWYWSAYSDNKILGRCVRLGYDDTVQPLRHYHWGIYRKAGGELAVQVFWHPEVWTTTRYCSALRSSKDRPNL